MLNGERPTLTTGVEDGFTVTVADAFASSNAALLAVTVTDELVVTAGAVRTPVLEIVPAVVDHTTDVLLVPLTEAENCLVVPAVTVALLGFRLTVIFVLLDGFTVTVAKAFAVAEAALVAVTVTYEVADTAGAVNTPVLEIDPAVVDQITPVFVVPLTLDVNC